MWFPVPCSICFVSAGLAVDVGMQFREATLWLQRYDRCRRRSCECDHRDPSSPYPRHGAFRRYVDGAWPVRASDKGQRAIVLLVYSAVQVASRRKLGSNTVGRVVSIEATGSCTKYRPVVRLHSLAQQTASSPRHFFGNAGWCPDQTLAPDENFLKSNSTERINRTTVLTGDQVQRAHYL